MVTRIARYVAIVLLAGTSLLAIGTIIFHIYFLGFLLIGALITLGV